MRSPSRMLMSNAREKFRFGDFELDVAAYELRRNGGPIRLERQPMDVLIMLVERRGLLVSREGIVDRLWGKDVFVDVETGVHTAIRKIRQALRDSREEPVFVETVTGKGYRFIAAVEAVSAAPDPGLPLSSRVTLAVLPFENFSGDSDREYLADRLAEETIASVGQIDPEHVSVIGRTSIMVYKRTTKSLAEIGRELGAHYLLESSLRAEGGRLRVRSEEHTSELQSQSNLVCRLLLEKKNKKQKHTSNATPTKPQSKIQPSASRIRTTTIPKQCTRAQRFTIRITCTMRTCSYHSLTTS